MQVNKELAKIFFEIADFLKAENVSFKPFAYRKAGITLQNLKDDVKEIYEKGGIKALEDIPGVGESIALKIEEYLKTGRIKYYDELKKKLPCNLEELVQIEGIGPRKAKMLYEKLGVRSLKDLEKAARAHKIAAIFGFGEKTEKNILEGLEFVKRSKGRFLLGEILPWAQEVKERFSKMKEVEKIEIAGSLRRRKETIGDVDFLVVSRDPEKIMERFVSLPGVVKIWGRGPTKSSVRLKQGFDVDLRVLPRSSYGAGLQYFTGSKEHNIVLRKIAISKKMKLSEYGLFQGNKMIAGREEKEIYEKLGMDWVPPELRENRGEIERALSHKLPQIINYDDIRGDLHCHIKWQGKWDGGANTIEQMAERAQEMGYEYLGIASHTKFLKIEHGLNEKQLEQRNKKIDKINSEFKKQKVKFRILKGCEANILNEGQLDINDRTLKKMDFVIAGIHSNFKMAKKKMTERLISAMKNPHVDIIAHPTGRIIKKRESYLLDIGKILRAAKQTNTILEINSYPERLDLSDRHIKSAKELGVKMVINTDAHHKDQMRYIEYGIAQARRGWAEKKDIINTQPLERLLRFFKS